MSRGIDPLFYILVVLLVGGVGAAAYFLFFSAAARSRRKMLERMKGLGQRNQPKKIVEEEAGSLRRNEDRTALDRLARRILPNPKILKQRLEATGKNISIGKYLIFSVLTAIAAGIASYMYAPVPAAVTPLMGIVAGIVIPHKLVNRWKLKRAAEFTDQLPDALDLIVRGVKSGLPVAETINSVSEEMPAPMGQEMARVMEDTRVGMALEAALWLAAERVNSPEFKFFCVCLSVQRETGGNLAETLDNLSELVRGRKQMKKKVRAVASEARASKYILGGLPIAIGAMLAIVANDYIMVLFTTDPGHIILGIGSVMMSIGWFVMDKMADFEV